MSNIATLSDMEAAAAAYPASMFANDTIYLKILSDGTVRAIADKATVNAPVEYGGGGGSYDMEISAETWKESEYTARIRNGKIYLGKDADEKTAEWAAAIRAERDRRLRACDKMSVLHWNVLTDYQKVSWAAYRQALLDLPEQDGFPWGGDEDAAPWPEKPEDTSTPEDLATAKKYKLQELNDALEETKASSQSAILSSIGYQINANTTAKTNIDGLITAMTATGTETVNFMTFDNQLISVTLEQLKTMQLELISYGNNLYARKWTLRSQIEAAETLEALDDITISYADVTA